MDKNLARGYIEKSTAKCSSPLLLVPKKGTDELRVCVDFRKLNAITKKRVHAPLPTAAYRNRIAQARWYLKYDIEEAFYHLRIRKEDRPKTTFRCHRGTFQFVVMPFGLTNAPAEFQIYIENILWELLGKHVTIHLDDILLFTDDLKTQTRHICSNLPATQ